MCYAVNGNFSIRTHSSSVLSTQSIGHETLADQNLRSDESVVRTPSEACDYSASWHLQRWPRQRCHGDRKGRDGGASERGTGDRLVARLAARDVPFTRLHPATSNAANTLSAECKNANAVWKKRFSIKELQLFACQQIVFLSYFPMQNTHWAQFYQL